MIKEIKTDLFGNKIEWHMHPRVNILGGGNGSGKTTLLKKIYRNMSSILDEDDTDQDFYVVTSGKDFKHVIYLNDQQVSIRKLVDMYFTNESVNSNTTPLELLIWEEFKKFNGDTDRLTEFANVCRKYNLSPRGIRYMSPGEQQEFLIYLTVFNIYEKPTLLLLDNMDSQMHIDRKQVLLRNLLDMNPNLQIIATTHSPSLISDSWFENTKEISQLITERNYDNNFKKQQDMKKVNYVVLMSWDEDNKTVMKWGIGEDLESIYDGLSFYQNAHPDLKYEIYEVNKKVK